jgi:hypothetical protein
MKYRLSFLLIFCLSISVYADESFIFSEYTNGTLNCGLKPLPKLGYRIGRCINGRWEQVSTGSSSTLNCGLKPLPKLGYRIGRCINGRWEQVSK